MAGDAEYIAVVPAQTGFAELTTSMLTGRFGLTTMLTLFDVAGFPIAHELILDVSAQLIISLFAGL